ncbi:MAG: T9SS type A sorting domain-containing protein [Panacibacter sp.]
MRKSHVLYASRTTMIFFTCLVSSQCLYAQTTSRKMNGGDEFDYGNCVIQTPDHGICIVGSTNSYSSGSYDVYVIKLDSNYNLEWSKTYDWGKNEYGSCAVSTKDNGIAIAGYCTTAQYFNFAADAFVLKINAQGKALWCKTIGGTESDNLNGIIENKRGDLIAAGSTRSYGSGLNDIYLVKLTPRGNLVWTHTYGTANEDIAYSITETKNGFGICGMSGNFLPFVARYDTIGNALWSKTISGNGATGVYNSITQTDDNGLALTGYTGTTSNGYDVLTTKINSNGVGEWCITLGNAGDDKGYSIMQDAGGDYVINGYADYARSGYQQSLYLIKLSSTGTLTWNKTITEENDAMGTSLCGSNDNGYIVTGCAWKTTDGYYYKPDIYLAKFDAFGAICGIANAQNDLKTIRPDIAVITFAASTGGVVTDNIVTSNTAGDFNELCSGVSPNKSSGVSAQQSNQVQQAGANSFKIKLLQNPVNNGVLKLQYNISVQKNMQLSIVNMQGNMVYSKKIQLTPQSAGVVSIDVHAYAAGYYLINMSDGITQQSIKFIKAN